MRKQSKIHRRPPKRRFLIVGEGRETEYNYFVGLRNQHESELNQLETSVAVRRGKGGDAKTIVEHAVKEARQFQPDAKRGDRVFLLLDTEGAGRAPELHEAEKIARDKKIEIVYSSPAIEYWLLCHFDNPVRSYFNDCAAVIRQLNPQWRTVCTTDYDKADDRVFNRIANRLDLARRQSHDIDRYAITCGDEPVKKNPSTQVYQLVARLLGVRSGAACPMKGIWQVVGKPDETADFNQGDTMPKPNNIDVNWKWIK